MEFALRAVRQSLNIFVVIYIPQATIVPNMNTLSQNIKKEFVLRAISQMDSKYI